MEQENKVVGLWPGVNPASHTQFPHADLPEAGGSYADPYELPVPGKWRKPLAIALCGGSALAWIAASANSYYNLWQANAPALPEIIAAIAQTASPLALVAVVWMLLLRSSRAEADRFSRTTAELHNESQRLEAMLASVSARIEASRRDLADQSNALLNLGDDAAQRMSSVSETMRRDVDSLSASAQTLKGTAAAARGDVAVLLSHLPKTQVQLRQIAKSLVDSGEASVNSAAALEDALARLSSGAAEADALSRHASETLGKQVGTILESSAQLCDALADAEERLDEVGTAKSEAIANRVTNISADLEKIGMLFGERTQESEQFSARMRDALAGLEERFHGLGNAASTVVSENAGALHDLEERSARLTSQFQHQGSKADEMSVRLTGLFERLEDASAHLDDQLPQVFGRLETSAMRALQTVNEAAPAMSEIAEAARSSLAQIADARSLLDHQIAAFATMGEGATASLQASQKEAEALSALVDDAQRRAQLLGGATTDELSTSLATLKNSVEQTVVEAERRLKDVIPAAASAFGQGSAEKFAQEVERIATSKIDLITEASERAASAARLASEQLSAQLKQILDASSALEVKVEQVRASSDIQGRDNFARRTALLIESLNSSAIDVTKILSNEVTDTAWSAYLKGDRGIFARRAVKLLDQADARDIARHYQEDSEFRDQVNRYIHDYEAMLRTVMATREGTPMSIALLSSDTGKLYVALAQAIERLRT